MSCACGCWTGPGRCGSCGWAGLANGRVGLVLKLHHSLADGLAAVQIAGLLLDSTATAPNPAAPWQPRPAPSGWALGADNLRGRSAALAAALLRLRHPGQLAAQARTLAGAAQLAAGGRHQRRSVLRRPVGIAGGWPSFGQGWPRSKLSPTPTVPR